ncbi:M64 family metallopeptidase [Planctomycetota bacterium]|nr:M64 family metallopeptidase [Planctomycetota bacterium]
MSDPAANPNPTPPAEPAPAESAPATPRKRRRGPRPMGKAWILAPLSTLLVASVTGYLIYDIKNDPPWAGRQDAERKAARELRAELKSVEKRWGEIVGGRDTPALDDLRLLEADLRALIAKTDDGNDRQRAKGAVAKQLLEAPHLREAWERAIWPLMSECAEAIENARDAQSFAAARAALDALPDEAHEIENVHHEVQRLEESMAEWRWFSDFVTEFLARDPTPDGLEALDEAWALHDEALAGRLTPAYGELETWFRSQGHHADAIVVRILGALDSSEPFDGFDPAAAAVIQLALVEGSVEAWIARRRAAAAPPAAPQPGEGGRGLFLTPSVLAVSLTAVGSENLIRLSPEGEEHPRDVEGYVVARMPASGLALVEVGAESTLPPLTRSMARPFAIATPLSDPVALKETNGPFGNRLDLYFLPDGFQDESTQQGRFRQLAATAVTHLGDTRFFREYDGYLNYWAVPVASAEAGVTRAGQPRQTAFAGQVVNDRYEVSPGPAQRFLEQRYAGRHDRLAVVIGNAEAGTATAELLGGVAACARDRVDAVPHELGHALAGLGDEYAELRHPEPLEPARVVAPNLVVGSATEAVRDLVPWTAWWDDTGESNWTGAPVALFEGESGHWHPQLKCLMNDNGERGDACAVCTEALVVALYRAVRPIDAATPEAEAVALAEDPLAFEVRVLRPASRELDVTWSVQRADGSPWVGVELEPTTRMDGSHAVHSLTLAPSQGLPAGDYRLSCRVTDPTPWVRSERELLQQDRVWRVTAR